MAPGGKVVEVTPQPGQTVLLHFWATWCPTCAVDMVALQNTAEKCSIDSVRIVLVNVGDSESDIESYVERHGIELPILLDPEGDAFRDFGGRGLPMNVEWSQDRLATDVAPQTEVQWRKRLAALGCALSP